MGVNEGDLHVKYIDDVDVILENCPIAIVILILRKKCCCLKKNQNAPRPSEHPPVRGGKRSKRLGGIKGCKNTKPLHGIQTGSPMEITLGKQYNVGEKPSHVILYTYINRHAGTPETLFKEKSERA